MKMLKEKQVVMNHDDAEIPTIVLPCRSRSVAAINRLARRAVSRQGRVIGERLGMYHRQRVAAPQKRR